MPPILTPASHKINLIGIGEDGWQGLNAKAQNLIEQADRLIGGQRHLDLLPKTITTNKRLQNWPSPLKPFLDQLITDYQAAPPPQERIVILASGNPMLYGIGASLQTHIPALITVIPHISTQSLICAQMGWAEQQTTLISLCNRPLEQLNAALFDYQRLIVLSNDNTSPSQVAQLLLDKGFGDSAVTVFENLGGTAEKKTIVPSIKLTNKTDFSKLNAMAIELRYPDTAIKGSKIYSPCIGLPEQAFAHDGQITKKEIRAITLAALSPRPNERLIDIGSGSGSIAIEWMRAAPNACAAAIEPRTDRINNIKKNALNLGVPLLEVVESKGLDYWQQQAPAKIDAIFIGGGLTDNPELLELCLQSLKAGGRLVVNAVTLESEALLYKAYQKHGGNLTQIQISKPDKIGRFSSWNPARPVTQWHYSKSYSK